MRFLLAILVTVIVLADLQAGPILRKLKARRSASCSTATVSMRGGNVATSCSSGACAIVNTVPLKVVPDPLKK
jgi:hypothetical protein